MKQLIDGAKVKMNKCVESLEHAYKDIRTSGANPNMVSNVEVEYYGFPTPLSQLAQISVVEGRQLYIKPFDGSITKAVEKAIFSANIGLTPQNEGTAIRINVPPLTEERRKEYTKVASKYAEEAKVAVRNVRRDVVDKIKKDKETPEDLRKSYEQDVQKLTDEFIKKIDAVCAAKSKEIMSI